MDFLTKQQTREILEEYLDNLPNNVRIMISTNHEKDFLHIGDTIERVVSKYQTYLSDIEIEKRKHAEILNNDYDKDIRQGNFSR